MWIVHYVKLYFHEITSVKLIPHSHTSLSAYWNSTGIQNSIVLPPPSVGSINWKINREWEMPESNQSVIQTIQIMVPIIDGLPIGLSKLTFEISGKYWGVTEGYCLTLYIFMDWNIWKILRCHMMMSRYGNAFHITGPLWEKSTSHWWISLTKGQ